MRACCIVGAGYSFVAGMPLTKDLFNSDVVITSQQARNRFQVVWRDYDNWRQKNSSGNAEEYLADLYSHARPWSAPSFATAVELLATVLATPRLTDLKPINPRYGVRIIQPSRCPAHTALWQTLTNYFEAVTVITTNYDLLIEKALRHRPMKRVFGPGCYYGGIPRPQILTGTALPFTVRDPRHTVELTGMVPVFKLHGSLNWTLTGEGLELYQDMRPAFRHGNDAAIVPPITEKVIPQWLKPVWEGAERELALADSWIVCGYSLPDYDIAIQRTLAQAAQAELSTIFILDPFSEGLRARYQRLAPRAKVYCLKGLPDGIEELGELVSLLVA